MVRRERGDRQAKLELGVKRDDEREGARKGEREKAGQRVAENGAIRCEMDVAEGIYIYIWSDGEGEESDCGKQNHMSKKSNIEDREPLRYTKSFCFER